MDVDPIMKKTTVRFAIVGAVLLSSALALALAQYDARQSSDNELVLAKPANQPPELIPVDDSPLWGHSFASSKTIVRANDDTSAQPPSLEYPGNNEAMPPSPLPLSAGEENPLRTTNSLADENDSESSVRLASGEGPPKGNTLELPSTMPALQPPSIPALTPPVQNSGADVIRAPKPDWTQAPPTLPSSGLPPSSTAMPTLAPNTAPTVPPTGAIASQPLAPPGFPAPRNSAAQSMSDTQMPAMPPTTLTNNSTAVQPPSTLNTPTLNNGVSNQPGQLIAAPSARLGAPTPSSPPASQIHSPSTSPSQLSSPGSPPALGNSSSSTNAFNSNNILSGNASDGARSPYAGTLLGRLISNQPGNSALLGSQNPGLLIQKRMAGECQVGKKATVIITVRNAGNSTVQDVELIDSVPSGARFAEAMPTVTPTAEGIMVWKLGEMGPNDERTITLQIIPERQGEMGSTAIVRIAAQASVRTLATLPKLELTFQAAPDVLIGSSHSIDVNVRNTGTGVARGVKLEADVPKNLRHDTGDTVLEAPFGDIAPGESKRIRLDTIAAEPGEANIVLRALTEDGVQQEQTAQLRVLAPALEAVITGPNRRYLDRQAKFQITIKNSGTATATKCEFTMRLPAGLNFNNASSHGEYSSTEHAVMWSVPEWPAGHSESIELTVLPVEIGPQQMIFQGTADLGVKLEARGGVTVEEQGELTFTIDQDADPIELSASTTYTVEVRNVGRPDRNVELSLQLPPGSEVLKVDAAVQARVEGDTLRFDPIAQMDGRTSQKFRVEVRHGKIGTQKVSAQLRSQNRPTLVIKEEATEVYNDHD